MKSKKFREIINKFTCFKNLKYHSPDYERLYKQYKRINKHIDEFFSQNGNYKNTRLIKDHIIAIYLYDESHNYPFTPTPASFIISRLLYTGSHKRNYNLTVPTEGMSFFLTFFRYDSEISQSFHPVIFSDKQKEELEKLIQAEEINFRERFKMLLEIIE